MRQAGCSGPAWRYVYEQAPILYMHLASEGTIIDSNRFTSERIVGDDQDLSIHDLVVSFAAPLDLDSLRRDAEQLHLIHVVTRNGLPEAFWTQFVPSGENTLVFGSLDADETGRLRQELIGLNNRLNALTRDLQKKNHELAQLDQLKNQFLGMAAHDLRKPVGAILSYTELLVDEASEALNDEQLGFLKTIYRSTDLMRRVIDDFLDISIIESGRLELDRACTPIEEPVERSVALNRIQADKRRVRLVVESHGSPPPISMDALKVEQVLNNLIANAVEHSPTDSVVHISLGSGPDGVQVAVSDDGPGIAPGDKDRLFKPYGAGPGTKPSGAQSTGLGLVISRKIIEAHGGALWIENKPGAGATFAFRLPGHLE